MTLYRQWWVVVVVVVGVADRRYGTFRYSTVRIAEQMQNVNTIWTEDATQDRHGDIGEGEFRTRWPPFITPPTHRRPFLQPPHALAAATPSCGRRRARPYHSGHRGMEGQGRNVIRIGRRYINGENRNTEEEEKENEEEKE